MNGDAHDRAGVGGLAVVRSLAQALLTHVANLPLTILLLVSLALVPLGVGLVLLPPVLLAVRGLTNQQRRWALDWSGVEIPVPYRPRPAEASTAAGGAAGEAARKATRVARWTATVRWLLRDPASWRDMLWTATNSVTGLVLGGLPAALVVYGLEGVLVMPWMPDLRTFGWGPFWPLGDYGLAGSAGCALLGSLMALLGWRYGPPIMRAYALVNRSMLGPPRGRLEERVRELTETRSETVDASAAELRRIERDLHDGAQARLVALSMHIGLAEQLVRDDPDAAVRLLAEAREASGTALTELRGLVRGIHPPVLAERGLDGGVRALALALPMPVEVTVDVPGRAAPPVESAAYFAVAEMLANAAKHADAERAWVEVRHNGSALVMIVGDDGRGGADPARGGGMLGIGRRLAAFDGTMAVASPEGGPTVVTMELPCALSSPKT
ncbi:sensor histidine kinase [Actinomadura logoneensis]|uniref:histidine kinase n=1 Tax=Actinomadura logoneensis TaxID=2293572 RepID=A0A372JL23_9ACTN|nr:histidine kinase [Actinomadura logoneensis]RFU40516.1 sensor histidine kinase [Actinomadura logoneensis]